VETRGKHCTPTRKGTVFVGMGMGTKKYTHGLPVSHPNEHILLERNLCKTLGDFDGQPVVFPEGSRMRPLKRLLGIHAIVATWRAETISKCQLCEAQYDVLEDNTADQVLSNTSILMPQDKFEHVSLHIDCFGHSFMLAMALQALGGGKFVGRAFI
jgi:hypothetical protein